MGKARDYQPGTASAIHSVYVNKPRITYKTHSAEHMTSDLKPDLSPLFLSNSVELTN